MSVHSRYTPCRQYESLRVISGFLSIVGAIFLIAAGVLGFCAMISLLGADQSRNPFAGSSTTYAILFGVPAVGCGLCGLILCAAAAFIKLQIDTEENTRAGAQILDSIRSHMEASNPKRPPSIGSQDWRSGISHSDRDDSLQESSTNGVASTDRPYARAA